MVNMIAVEQVRQRCGTVYTWNCAGELYGIECELCEERPLCPLNEFAEHMDLWHSDWQQTPDPDDLIQEVLAEQSSGSEVNELKQQLVQELNALDQQQQQLLIHSQPLQQQQQQPEQQQQQAEIVESQQNIDFGQDNVLPNVEHAKLTTEHVQQLIELYRGQPRLWNQTHAEFRNMELGRESWQQITDAWSEHCGRRFTVTDVRIRISTLCQRFLKQRERLVADGDVADLLEDDVAKFVHYDQLKFLCEQQALLKRHQHYARENRKLLEIYEHYPILWHNAHKRLRCVDTLRQRHEALRGLQLALRMCDIRLSGLAIKRRLQSLRKRYRLEKIRYLHCVIDGKQSEFVSSFEHYAAMEFLHKHIDPYVCAICGKIFENLVAHQAHVQGSCVAQQVLDEEEEESTITAAATVGELMVQLEQQQHLEIPQPVTDDAVTPFAVPAADASLESPATVEEELNTPLHSLAAALTTNKSEEPEELTSPTASKLRVRLSLQQTHKLIELYRGHPNLWDPNHLDYHARQQRRLAWHNIARQLNDASVSVGCPQHYSWQMLHRKLTDYTKYYRRERLRQQQLQQQQQQQEDQTRWSYYEAFSFLDDVVPISCVLQKSLQQRDSNLKIIQVYRSYEQLWCTTHPDYTKRKQRQRQLESLCTRLQEDCNLQLTVERLKNRLIEFRYQYRQCKESRQAAQKRGESWQPKYEYYVHLQFLELHVSPFECSYCPTSFKRRTDCLRHQRNLHLVEEEEEQQQLPEISSTSSGSTTSGNPLEHICHICAMKFSLRTSLLAHLRRHLGQRTHACNECPKKFFNSTSLRVHQRSHTKELPYVCEHCARGFVNASKLNQHVKRHADQRDYPCTRCDKAFYTAHERDRHTRAHLNIRDKVCPYCGRAFVVGSAYYAHLNLHRVEKRYGCADCGQRFAQYAGLYKHRKRCNNLQQQQPQQQIQEKQEN